MRKGVTSGNSQAAGWLVSIEFRGRDMVSPPVVELGKLKRAPRGDALLCVLHVRKRPASHFGETEAQQQQLFGADSGFFLRRKISLNCGRALDKRAQVNQAHTLYSTAVAAEEARA